jgi:hypothetical protein
MDPDGALRADVEQTKRMAKATVYSGDQEQADQV